MKTCSTFDYGRFSFIKGNRNVDHVKAIVKSIQSCDLTAFNPILVTPNFEILDGQNRFEACKLLGKPIYYTICDSNIEAISIIRNLNISQRNWRTRDYIYSFIDMGDEKMKDYVDFAERYGFKNEYLSVAAAVYFGKSSCITKQLRQGTTPEKWEYAEEIGKWLLKAREKGFPYWQQGLFVRAVVRFRYNHTEKEMEKILRHIDKLTNYGSTASYVNRFQQIIDAVKVR